MLGCCFLKETDVMILFTNLRSRHTVHYNFELQNDNKPNINRFFFDNVYFLNPNNGFRNF